MERYKECQVLGRGSFGEASLVLRKKDNMPFVLKKVSTGPNVPEKEKESAEKEMTVLQKFHHPHIVKYLDSFQTESHTCIVMEYCGEGSLEDMIEARRKEGLGGFPEEEALDIFVQLLMAVEHVHARRVFHRDLKPANVFVSQHKMMKLGDFGIARQLSAQTNLAATVVGTPYYLSPEICKGLPYDNSCDIWALGCILHELLTLGHCFEGLNLPMIVMNIVQGKREPLPEGVGSENVRNLLDRMLHAEPEMRPKTSEIIGLFFIMEAQMKLDIRLREAVAAEMKIKLTRRSQMAEDENEDAKSRATIREETVEAVQWVEGATYAELAAEVELNASMFSNTTVAGAAVNKDQGVGDVEVVAPPWGMEGTGCFCWGDSHGQPAFDHSMHNLQVCETHKTPLNRRVEALSFGRYHKLVLMQGGELMSWQYNGHKEEMQRGQLGRTDQSGTLGKPYPVPSLVGMVVTAVSCGLDHSLAVTSHGEVYAWGDGEGGQLGLGEDVTEAHEPQLVGGILQGVPVAEVACGAEFSLARCEHGGVYSWGRGDRGQLGVTEGGEALEEAFEPLQVMLPRKSGEDLFAVSIACGEVHAAVIAVEGSMCGQVRSLLTWGDNEHGQLGRTEDDEENCRGQTPKVVGFKCLPQQVSLGSKHTAMLDEGGLLYTWGYSECMQQSGKKSQSVRKKGARPVASGRAPVGGAEEEDEDVRNADVRVPQKVDWAMIPDFQPETTIKSVTCGDDCTFVLTDQGRIFSWGIGGKYRLGHNNEDDVKKPKLIGGQLLHHEFSQVVAHHSAVHAVALVQGLTGTFKVLHCG